MDAFGEALVRIAVGAVRTRLAGDPVRAESLLGERDPVELRQPGASFVTLERRGRLRGCIGTLAASRALYVDVARNAERAMRDPRMPPVGADDWPELTVKVSVLSAPAPMDAPDLEALCAELRPGVDGLVLTDGSRRATFLPAVWDRIPQPERFVAALLRKGGWDEWPPGLRAQRYGSVEFTAAPPPGGRT